LPARRIPEDSAGYRRKKVRARRERAVSGQTGSTPAQLQRWWRFGAVSAMNVVVTQTLLQSFYGFTSIGAAWANVLAVGLSSIPAFVILRRWVWAKTGDCSVTREIIPFWTYSFLGLIVSTAAVAAIEARWQSAIAVSVANIACFGALWVTKFLLLDRWLFGNQSGRRSDVRRRRGLVRAHRRPHPPGNRARPRRIWASARRCGSHPQGRRVGTGVVRHHRAV
jgi:putative flippase GtrA